MSVSHQVGGAFDECFDAAIGLADWPIALQKLGEALGADSSVLLPNGQDFSERRRVQFESAEHASFTDIWLARIEDPLSDPHSARSRYPIRSYSCVTEHQITTDDERAQLPYFNEVARPGKREWWAILRANTRHQAWCLNFYRGGRQGPFGPAEAAEVSRAAPRLARLGALIERLAEAGWDARLDSLNRLRLAAFLIDREGRVLNMNAAGEARLGRGLALFRRRLAVEDADAQVALSQFMHQIAQGAEPPGPLVLGKAEDWRLLIEYLPCSDRSVEVFSGAKGVVLVSDLAARPPPRKGLLQEAFDLTPAEERLALELVEGQGLAGAARALGIGHETARSQLRLIFDKTGARNQAQLSILLTRLIERLQKQNSHPNG
jgi:DNA-binding CsgD family transcriptional regulator